MGTAFHCKGNVDIFQSIATETVLVSWEGFLLDAIMCF